MLVWYTVSIVFPETGFRSNPINQVIQSGVNRITVIPTEYLEITQILWKQHRSTSSFRSSITSPFKPNLASANVSACARLRCVVTDYLEKVRGPPWSFLWATGLTASKKWFSAEIESVHFEAKRRFRRR